MATKWTPAQHDAITANGGELLVLAAAGSGKTSVLVERALELVTGSNAIRADRLMIITFTRSAAAELKERLYTAFERLCAQNPQNELYRKQSIYIRRATIGTVDAFCSALVRENFGVLDIPPDFTLDDGALMMSMKHTALDDALNELYANDKGFVEFATLFGRSKSDTDAADMILRLHGFLETQADADAYREKCLAPLALPFEQTPFYPVIKGFVERELVEAIARLDRAEMLCNDGGVLEGAYLDAVKSDANAARLTLQLVREGKAKSALNLLRAYEFPRLKSAKGGDPVAKDEAKALRDASKKRLSDTVLDNLAFLLPERYEAEKVLLTCAVGALFRACALFDKKLSELKLRKKIFAFYDISKYALALLRAPDGSPSELAREVSARYDAVMVDEYQDTNELQDALYTAVTRKNRENLFLVGDIKQSIYGFRAAEPDIILEVWNRCEPMRMGRFPASIHLNENFRSTFEVAQGINTLFDKLMTTDSCGIDYAQSERLVCGSGRHTSDGKGVELALVPEGDIEDRAAYIALRIRALVDGGFVINDPARGTRVCEYGDICVLLRSTKDKSGTFVDALKRNGIPAADNSNGGFLESEYCTTLLAALEAVSNPRRSVSLAALLTSARFDFSPSELVALRAEDRRAGLYALLTANSHDPRCAEVLAFIRRMRALAARTPIEDFVRLMADELSLPERARAIDGERGVNNVREFALYAQRLRSELGVGLSGFVTLALRAKKDNRENMPKGAGVLPNDRVNVITIHGAKGLEWPIVFWGDVSKKFSDKDLKLPIIFNRKLGMGARVFRNIDGKRVSSRTCAYMALRIETARKLMAEELRLMYVALTRARDKAIMVAEYKTENALDNKADSATEYSFFRAQTALDWVLSALGGACAVDFGQVGGVSAFRASIEQADAPAAPDEPPIPAKPDKALAAELERRMRWTYPALAECAVPAKISVSALTKTEREATVRRPAFALTDGMSGAEKGTATHEFMQYADYENAARSIDEELERLVVRRYLDPAAAEGVNRAELETLFKSDFMRRIISSDRVEREYEFFSEIDASILDSAAKGKVIVQGIADCVYFENGRAVVVDYKTDRVRTAQTLLDRYSLQLQTYKKAIGDRLSVPVERCIIYSFALGEAIDVPDVK